MPMRLLPIVPVLLGVLCAEVALGLMTTLIPLLLLQMHTAAPLIGLVTSAYYVGFLGGALSADRVVRRVGHIRAFAVFAACAADAALLLVLAEGPWVVAALRLLIGYASSGLFLVAESWLNDRADQANRGRVFGAYLVVSWGASALGPLALNLVKPTPMLFVWVGIAFATAVLPMALSVQANPPVPAQAHIGVGRLFRVSPVGVVCAFVSGLVNSAYYGLVPLYLRALGYGTPQVAAFTSLALLGGLAVQVPAGWLADRLGRRKVTVGVMLASLLLTMATATAGHLPYLALAALGFAYAAATAPLYGLGAGQVNDRMERGDYVAASGALLFTWSVGSSIGPFAAGGAIGLLGPSGLFAYLGAVVGAAACFVIGRVLVRPGVRPEQRGAPVLSLAVPARSVQLGARMMHTLRHPAELPAWRALLRPRRP